MAEHARALTRRPTKREGRQFRPPEIVVGVLVVAGCALAAVLWQRSVDRTVTVVVAARPIARGTVLSADDLTGTQVGGDTDALVTADDAQQLIGKVATVDIATDMPFVAALVSTAEPLAADEALTAVSLSAGQLPPDLAANDSVRIVLTGATDLDAATPVRMLDDVLIVWAVVPAPDGVSTIVTLRGPLSLATAVAAASTVRLVRVGDAPSIVAGN